MRNWIIFIRNKLEIQEINVMIGIIKTRNVIRIYKILNLRLKKYK